jgi:hypothetical protein
MRRIRYENVALLTMAAIFSIVATVVLSVFLEPSQPPTVAAVEIGDPRESPEGVRASEGVKRDRARGDAADRKRRERKQVEAGSPTRPRSTAPSRAPSPQPQAAPAPAPAQPIAPAAPDDDDAGEAAEADDDGD